MLEAERLNLEKLKEWVEARHIPEDPPQTSLELSKALVPIPPPQPADRAMNARLFRSATRFQCSREHHIAQPAWNRGME